MVRHWHIVNYHARTLFTVGFGMTARFALGFSIDRYSFNVDIGPLWFYLEW